jgi:hypothetical protein
MEPADMAKTSADSAACTGHCHWHVSNVLQNISPVFINIVSIITVNRHIILICVVWSYRTEWNEGKPTALSVFGVTSCNTPTGNLTVWCKAVIGPKASIHKQLSNEHVELVIQTQDAARCKVSRQHTTGKDKKLLMIANVSQYWGKVTVNTLWDYCLIVRYSWSVRTAVSIRTALLPGGTQHFVSAELGVTVFWAHLYLVKTGCHDAEGDYSTSLPLSNYITSYKHTKHLHHFL